MKAENPGSLTLVKSAPQSSVFDTLARRIVLSRLQDLTSGQIGLSENGEHCTYGELDEDFPLTAQIRINHPRFYGDIAFGGAIGAAEAFIRGYWSCDELTTFLRILLKNRKVLEKVSAGLASVNKPLQKLFHFMNQNTRAGSERNIAAHYDLGNDFYKLWLDESMMYSCAWFPAPETTLESASELKLQRICEKLELTADDSVIEIGTGWGAFAVYAARNYGCHVTTTTISREQHDYAKQQIADAGLEDRITLLFDDYRDLTGRFDKLVSIEMIEAVGHRFHNRFFSKCQELLKPDGQMLLQAITIADQRYDDYRNGVDFIQRYIFPGGCLTSVTDMTAKMTKLTDLRVIHLEDIGPHYATTLSHWRDRFLAKLDQVRDLGYSEDFIRLWQFYLCYCEAAFIERATGTVQMLMMRPNARSGYTA